MSCLPQPTTARLTVQGRLDLQRDPDGALGEIDGQACADEQMSGWNPAFCVEAMVRDIMVSLSSFPPRDAC